jgi:5-oxoprolinase (ATP-hydrolysing)
VVIAAVLYAFRTLIRRPIPLNAGCLEPIRIRIPPGSLLDPRPPAAVCGGNVETSMRVVDVLLGALGAAAASQGTMNNLTFGNDRFGYYETICGGAGAGPGFAGADAVHTHMTNTRITDAEVLERRYPVLVRELSIRRGSGGAGRFPGGAGARRVIEALAPLRAAILSERRAAAPFGLAGGSPGARGRNALIRGDRVIELPGKVRLDLLPGDALVIETPGGGGYGGDRLDEPSRSADAGPR